VRFYVTVRTKEISSLRRAAAKWARGEKKL